MGKFFENRLHSRLTRLLLGGLGLLNGKRATAYPGFEKYLTGATCTGEAVVVDGNIISARGPGVAQEFSLEIIKNAVNASHAESIARQTTIICDDYPKLDQMDTWKIVAIAMIAVSSVLLIVAIVLCTRARETNRFAQMNTLT